MFVIGEVEKELGPARGPCAGDRRQASRADQQLRVRVLLREDRFAASGYTENVSCSGALVRTSVPLRLNALYEFFVQGPDDVERAEARVVREMPYCLYAVEFERPLLPCEW
jgi:hypothetical protein